MWEVILNELTLCKDVGNVPVLWVIVVDYSPPTPAQSALLPTSDSSQDLCPGCPGTCPTSGLWMTANAWRGQINHSARCQANSVYGLPCFVVPPYCHVPRGHCFLCSHSGPQPHSACGGCSSVSGSPGDISWYFLPTPRRSQVALQSFTFLQV